VHDYPKQPALPEADAWNALLAASRGDEGVPVVPDAPEEVQRLFRLYGPLLAPRADRPWVVAHLAQSLDGRIALPSGESQWISGEEDLRHTHRLRALVDAVVVGARTVERDDPRLTVRRVTGPDPLRVVIVGTAAPQADRLVFTDGLPTVLVCAQRPEDPGGAEVELIDPGPDGVIAPGAVLGALAARGVRRVLVEGGGVTVSRFLSAGCVDRLHLTVAPLLMGHGRPALSDPLSDRLAGCPRPDVRVERLGDDWLFDCALRSE